LAGLRSPRPLTLLAAIVAAGAALRFATLTVQSFWLDEAIAIHSARLDLGGMIDSIARTEGNPPLYFGLLDGWMRLFGDSEAGARSLSALIGTATIPLAYVIGRRLATARVGLVAAALVAFNPLLVWFSQEARPYALLVLLSGLSLLFFVEALERPARRPLIGWAVASGLALATHYFAGLVILPEAAWLLWRVRPRRPAVLAVAGFAIVPLALLPLVAKQGQVQDYSFVKGEPLLKRVVAQVPKQMLIGFDAPAETVCAILAGALVLVAVAMALRRAEGTERRAMIAGGALGLAAVGIAFALAVVGADYFVSRYLLAAWLPLALVVAAGAGARRAGRPGAAVAIALCALFTFVVLEVDRRPDLQRDDWRGIARALGPAPAGGTRAIVASPIHAEVPLDLYLSGLHTLGPAGATIDEIDAVSVAEHVPGSTRGTPPVPQVGPPPPFRRVAVHRGDTYAVVVYRSPSPQHVTPATIAPLALQRGAPDFLVQDGER
jgi:hypothetical protein